MNGRGSPASRVRGVIGRAPWVALWVLLLGTALGLQVSPWRDVVPWLLGAASVIALVPEAVSMIRALRSGRVGVDVLAIAAVVSTLAVGEVWAAAVVVLMLLVGAALEQAAFRRARLRLSALVADTPSTAHVRRGGAEVDVSADAVVVGDELLVLPGETVPVDCTLLVPGVLDTARLTGESLPVELAVGDRAASGAVVVGAPLRAVAAATAEASEYQQVVRLVAEASESRAPVVRLADRYALPFTAIAFAIAAVGWIVGRDPVRFAEVLVVATPCPLLLAAPIAFVAGIGRAAKAGVIVRDGGTLETLARARTVAFDKTGTITEGRPVVSDVLPAGPSADVLLATAASVERASAHPLARAIVEAAERRGLQLPDATDAREEPGGGVRALVAGEPVVVGTPAFLLGAGIDVPERALPAGATSAAVAIDGRYAGALLLADRPRAEARAVIGALRGLRVVHLLIVSGDRPGAAAAVGAAVGVDEVHGGCRPEDKVRIVRAAVPRPVVMVGDGVNDAPVLAAADLGIAMGARGSGAAADAARVVLLVDDLGRLVEGLRIARSTLGIATRAILVGIVLSVVLMVVAVTGVLPALAGALLQEGVDLTAILLALRAAVPGPTEGDLRPSSARRPRTTMAG